MNTQNREAELGMELGSLGSTVGSTPKLSDEIRSITSPPNYPAAQKAPSVTPVTKGRSSEPTELNPEAPIKIQSLLI